MTTILTRQPLASLSFAKTHFQRGTDCLGPDEVEQVFGIKLADVPPIPFTEEELTRARELGQILLLFVPNDADGNLLTMKRLRDILCNKLGAGKLLYEESWYAKEPFYTTTPIVPAPIWKLVSHDVIPGSTNVNYLDQTVALVRYLTEEVYQDEGLPMAYDVAASEFDSSKDRLTKLMRSDWKKAAEELTALKVNQLFRLSPGELLYLIAFYRAANKEYLLEDMYSWTASRSNAFGGLVYAGGADSDGAGVDIYSPRDPNDDLGVLFSRSGLAES